MWIDDKRKEHVFESDRLEHLKKSTMKDILWRSLMKLCKVIRRQFYIENMRKNFQYSLILISCTLIGLQIYLTLFFSKNKVILTVCALFYNFAS